MYDASFVSDKTKTIVSAVLGCDPDQVETLNLHDHGMDSIISSILSLRSRMNFRSRLIRATSL